MVTRTKTVLTLTPELKEFKALIHIYELTPYEFAEHLAGHMQSGKGNDLFHTLRQFAIPQGTPVPQAVINLAKEYANESE